MYWLRTVHPSAQVRWVVAAHAGTYSHWVVHWWSWTYRQGPRVANRKKREPLEVSSNPNREVHAALQAPERNTFLMFRGLSTLLT